MNSLNRIIAIAKNTFRETLRDRILWSALVVSLVLIAVALFAGSISLGQEKRLLVNIGLSAIYILQIFVAIFIGSMLIWKEVDRKSFFLIIPKPITREEIIMGKCAGLLLTNIAVTSIATTVLFALFAFKGVHEYYVLTLLSIGLSLLESLLLILLSILFSGLTSPILSAIYTIAFFLIGHSSEILRNLISSAGNVATEFMLKCAYYLLPNLEKFNIRNEVVYGILPDMRGVAYSIGYALVYAIFLFFLARFMFRSKEF